MLWVRLPEGVTAVFHEHFAKQGGTFRLKVLLMPNGHLYSRVYRLADVPGVQLTYLINVYDVHMLSYCVRMLTQFPCLAGLYLLYQGGGTFMEGNC